MHIKTDRLAISPAGEALSQSNLRDMVKWLNDPAIVQYSEQRHYQHTIATQTAYIARFSGDDRLFSIFKGGRLIGTASIVIDPYNQVGDVGLLIGDKESWGTGVGYEAWSAICDHYLQSNLVRKIEAGCMSINISMSRICQKYGMKLEGEQVNHFLLEEGRTCSLLRYGKVR